MMAKTHPGVVQPAERDWIWHEDKLRISGICEIFSIRRLRLIARTTLLAPRFWSLVQPQHGPNPADRVLDELRVVVDSRLGKQPSR